MMYAAMHGALAQQVKPTDAQRSDKSDFKNKNVLRRCKPIKKAEKQG